MCVVPSTHTYEVNRKGKTIEYYIAEFSMMFEYHLMGSLGCFGLNGRDQGNNGRDRFIKNISELLDKPTEKIIIIIHRLKE